MIEIDLLKGYTYTGVSGTVYRPGRTHDGHWGLFYNDKSLFTSGMPLASLAKFLKIPEDVKLILVLQYGP